MNFSLRLKELREKKQISQKQLAIDLGVGVGSVGMWESSDRTPPAKKLKVIADYFGVSIDYLLGIDNEPKPTDENKKDIIERPSFDLSDKQFVDLMKLYKVMTEIQKAHVLGYIIAYLEREGVNVKTVLGY